MEEKRGPGRPKAEAVLKKGVPSWKPASVTDVTHKDPDSRYRWVNKDSDNLAKKQAEGWNFVDAKTDGSQTSAPRIEDGNSMTSVVEKRDVVLMKIPEEVAQGRDAYMNNKADKRISGLTAHIKEDLDKEGADMHGDITISSRRA